MPKSVIVFIGLLFAGCLIVGCAGQNESAKNKKSNQSSQTENSNASMDKKPTADELEIARKKVDLPEDIVVLSAAKYSGFQDVEGQRGVFFQLESSAQKDAMKNLETMMTEKGWAVDTSVKSHGLRIAFLKGDRSCSITIAPKAMPNGNYLVTYLLDR